MLASGCSPESATSGTPQVAGYEPGTVRVGLFNIRELRAAKLTGLEALTAGTTDASSPADDEGIAQVTAAISIVRAMRPDILIVQEIDAPPEDPAVNARRLRDLLRAELPSSTVDSEGAPGEPIDYPHVYSATTNTGTLSGHDLDGDGQVATSAEEGSREHGGDSWGYGTYPGEYGMAVLSRFPLGEEAARTFQNFRWANLPGHHQPIDFYDDSELAALRLSSKSHWDLPVTLGENTLHLLVSHPTPPAFDGDEDRNGRRNLDEIRLWELYLDNRSVLTDDQGQSGGLEEGALFVIAGDQNAAPTDDVVYGDQNAIGHLLEHPRVQNPSCTSSGGLAGREPGPPNFWEEATAGFRGGRRWDYLLPARALTALECGVFWPTSEENAAGAAMAERASDHRFVWLDISLAATR